jgi:hypothetical protein
MQYEAILRDRGCQRCTKRQLNAWIEEGIVVTWRRLAIMEAKEIR